MKTSVVCTRPRAQIIAFERQRYLAYQIAAKNLTSVLPPMAIIYSYSFCVEEEDNVIVIR